MLQADKSFLAGIVTGAFSAVIALAIYFGDNYANKEVCEKNIPRSQECVQVYLPEQIAIPLKIELGQK